MAKKTWKSDDMDREMTRMNNAMSDMFAGMAEAWGKGFRTMRREVSADNVSDMSCNNGLANGAFKGMADTIESGAQAMREAWEGYVDTSEDQRDETEAAAAPEIDYERLAKLVAAELRKGEAAGE